MKTVDFGPNCNRTSQNIRDCFNYRINQNGALHKFVSGNGNLTAIIPCNWDFIHGGAFCDNLEVTATGVIDGNNFLIPWSRMN